MKEKLQKHTLLLYEGDYERVQSLSPDTGAAFLIRTLIRTYINKVDPPVNLRKLKMKEEIDV